MNIKRIIIEVVLAVIIIFLAFKVYNSVKKPLEFEKTKKSREEVVVQRLKDIREAQIVYKSVHQSYANNFDSLINFIKEGKLPVILKKGELTDEMLKEGYTEIKACKEGLIKRDTTYVPVRDSLFKDRPDLNIENLRYIPFTDNKVEFEMAADTMVIQTYDQPVFEAKAENKYYLADQDEQLLRNFNKKLKDLEKFEGLKVGSLTEPSTDGNWE